MRPAKEWDSSWLSGRLVKTCNFGAYLKMALRDQLVCGLCDQKTQKELLYVQHLTIAVATDRAKAAEAITQEAKQINPDPVSTHQLSKQTKQTMECHSCSKPGHTGANCTHKDKRCHYCKKVRHLSSACTVKKKDSRSWRSEIQKGQDQSYTHSRSVVAVKKSLMLNTTMCITQL